MARTTGLRVVDPEAPTPDKAPVKAKNVKDACDSGDRRAVLVALRTRLARTIDDPGTPARDLAALSRRLLEVTKDLDSLTLAEAQERDEAATPDERWEAI